MSIFTAMPALLRGNIIEILWPNRCDEHCKTDCGMCKTSIIRSYDAERYERIIIGDSITDFEGAKLVDTIFATIPSHRYV